MKSQSISRMTLAAADPGLDLARRAWNLTVVQRPALVAVPESADDVAAVVRYAIDRGLRIVAQGSGHGAAALGDLADTVLIRTRKMRGLVIDPVTRTARAEAGALSRKVTDDAAAYGLAGLVVPRPTSACSATGWAAAWAGWAGPTGCRRTTCRPSRRCSRPVSWYAPMLTMNRTYSGRCAAGGRFARPAASAASWHRHDWVDAGPGAAAPINGANPRAGDGLMLDRLPPEAVTTWSHTPRRPLWPSNSATSAAKCGGPVGATARWPPSTRTSPCLPVGWPSPRRSPRGPSAEAGPSHNEHHHRRPLPANKAAPGWRPLGDGQVADS